MKPLSTALIRLLRPLPVACLTLLSPAALHAQVATGNLTGRVSDATTGRSLQGAVVRIANTPYRDFTDSEGRYSLPGVPAGTYRVEVDYLGLDPMVESVTIRGGAPETFNAALKSTVLEMETVTVSGSARGQALAINQQKTAAGIINIVSEETFGAMNDGNVGYALQRLPGISVDEAQDGSPTGINLRGVSGELNSLQIDGNRAPNSGGTSRAADTRQLIADGVANIEVIKAPTPDRDGDAIGGIINIVSRSAFQREGREIKLSASASYNDLAEKWGYNTKLTFSDLYSVGGKEDNLGISFTATSYTTDRYSENSDIDWVFVTAATNPTLNLTGDTKFLEASHSERSFRRTHTYGVNGSIDFRLDDNNSFYFRPLYSHYDQDSETFETDWDVDTRFQDEVGGRKTYAFLSSDGSRGGGTPGTNGSRSTLGYIGTDDKSYNDLYSFSIGGKHEVDSSTLSYDFHYSSSKFVREDFTEFNMRLDPITQGYYVMEYDATNRLRPQFYITNGLSPTNFDYARQGPVNLIIVPRTKDEEVYSAKVDWEKKFIGDRFSNAIKIGAKYRSSEPEFNQESSTYQVLGANRNLFPFEAVTTPATGDVLGTPRYLYALPKEARKVLASQPGLWTLQQPNSFNASNQADFSAKESTTAAYVMGTTQFGRHTIIGGIRTEMNKWKRTNKKVNNVGGLSTTLVSSSADYDVWLPGLHFRHELAENLILRESYNRSYGRPSLNDISRGRVISTTGNISEGNAALQPSLSDNFDAQVEYYTQNGGLYSVGVFYKDIQDFTFTNIIRFNELDGQDNPIPATNGAFTYTKPLNGPGAVNYGLELIARQRLYFLPGALRGLSASVSATFTESDAEVPGRENDDLPLEGFSDYLFTSSLEYVWKNFRARVDYRYRSDRIEGLDDSVITDEWFAAAEQVDAEITYEIRKGLSVYVTGTNLTHRPQVSYTGSSEFPEDVSYSGRKYIFGVDYTF
ncbi:TonB-dependent receptor [Opitutaceae bacterium]